MDLVNQTLSKHKYLTKVYAWLCVSLIISMLSAFMFMKTSLFLNIIAQLRTPGQMFICGAILFTVEMLLMGMLSYTTHVSAPLAGYLMILLSVLTGGTLAIAMFGVSSNTILLAFLTTSGTFAGMSIVGMMTKKDLTSCGNAMYGALIAFLIVSFTEMFFTLPVANLVMTWIGIGLFSTFITYDTNRIVNAKYQETNGNAIIGTLAFYMDFINLFLQFINLQHVKG